MTSRLTGLTLIAVFTLGLAGLLLWSADPPGSGTDADEARHVRLGGALETGPYVGTDSCMDCHPGIHAHYVNSGHARTLRLAADRRLARELDGRTFEDPEWPDATWRFAWDEDRLELIRHENGQVERQPVEFALGSGHHATTFVSLLDDDPRSLKAIEHRITYFREQDRLGVTPGQTTDQHPTGNPSGYALEGDEVTRCFGCHTTRLSTVGADRIDLESMIPNVTCERCHGPGREHVRAAQRGAAAEELSMPFGPGDWTAEGMMELCGRCHRHPNNAPPGVIRPDNSHIARFQPVGVMQSRCYIQSRGTYTCVTCHDPHARVESDPLFYEAICLDCHTGLTPESPTVHLADGPLGCLDCHMPKVDSGQAVLFTDHWIRVPDDPLGLCTRPVASP